MIVASVGMLAINIVADRTLWLYPIAVALFWLGVIELRMPRDHGDKTKQR